MLVYFRGFGDFYLNEDCSGSGYQRTKVEHRTIDPNHPRTQRSFFYWPNDIVEGVFKLTEEDDSRFKLTGKFKPDDIKKLLPADHQNSAFLKLVQNKRLPEHIFNDCYFEIVRNLHFDFAIKRRPHLKEQGKLDSILEIVTQKRENHTDSSQYESENKAKNDFEFSGLLNLPSSKDDWFRAIDDMVKEFHTEKGYIPNETQAWLRLANNSPDSYYIRIKPPKEGNKKTEIVLTMPDSRDLDRKNFNERYRKYTDISQN